MGQQRLHAEGGAYRGAYVVVWSCAGCRVTSLDLQSVAARRSSAHARLSATPLCRSAERVSEACGGCLASLQRLTISWDRHWAEIEECPRCALLYLDAGELARLASMLEASADVPTGRWLAEDESAATEAGAVTDALLAWLGDAP